MTRTFPYGGEAAVELDFVGSAGWAAIVPGDGDCTTHASGNLPGVVSDTVSVGIDATSFDATTASVFAVGDWITGLDAAGAPQEVRVTGVAGDTVTHTAAGMGFSGTVHRMRGHRWSFYGVDTAAEVEVRLHAGTPDPLRIGHKLGGLSAMNQLAEGKPVAVLWLKGDAGRVSLILSKR